MSNIKIETFSDIPFSKNFQLEDFNNRIKDFDLIGSLMSLQKLGALMANQIAVNANIEFEFYSSPKIKLKAGLLTRDFISFTAKQCLLCCNKAVAQYNDIDLLNLLYTYGNLETDINKIKSDEDRKNSGWLWMIRATNHQWYYLRFHSTIIARYYWIFTKIFEKNSALGEKINEALGLDIFKIMQIGTCIYANFCLREDGIQATSFLIDSYTNTTIETLKPLLTEENINKFLEIFSATQEEFKKASKIFELSDPLLKKYEFNPLKRFPVIKTNSGEKNKQFIVPSLADFLYATFEGLYYLLLDKLSPEDKKSLFELIGKIFEGYIEMFIKDYKIDSLTNANLIPEKTYMVGKNQWKSADWLLTSNDYIFQIECKKRKIDNYSRAGIQNDDGNGIDKLVEDLAKELDKMIEKEDHLKSGHVDGVQYKDQKIINLIVFFDEMFALNQYARDKVKEKMKRKSDNFYILGCWEFELLCEESKNKGQSMYDALQTFSKGEINAYQIDLLDRIYHDFFDSILTTD